MISSCSRSVNEMWKRPSFWARYRPCNVLPAPLGPRMIRRIGGFCKTKPRKKNEGYKTKCSSGSIVCGKNNAGFPWYKKLVLWKAWVACGAITLMNAKLWVPFRYEHFECAYTPISFKPQGCGGRGQEKSQGNFDGGHSPSLV